MSSNNIRGAVSSSGRAAGKRVLVTGAARGMGRSHAVRLAEEGADLILVDICASLPELEYPLASREDLDETARLVEKHDRRAVIRVVDIRDADALAAAVASGVRRTGWAGCGRGQRRRPDGRHLGCDDFRAMAHRGRCQSHRYLEHLRRGTSAPGRCRRQPDPDQLGGRSKRHPLHLPYTASKHGVVGLSRALANELAAQNVRVNTVHPTGVATGMRPESLHGILAETRPDLIPIFLNALPIVMAEPIDISNAVLFLVSDESRFVTGLEFKVDAGVTLR